MAGVRAEGEGVTPRCHISRRGLRRGPPGRERETRSAPPRVQQALRGEGSPADLHLKAQSPCPGHALLFWLLLTQLGLFSWRTGDARFLLLFRADDEELLFLFRGTLGDFFSLFAFLRLSINFKNLTKVSLP